MANVPHTLIKGQRFVASPILTVAKTESKIVEVPRTWKERLLGRPWKPLKKTKMVTTYTTTHEASREVIRLGDTYYAHPDLIAEIVAATQKEEE